MTRLASLFSLFKNIVTEEMCYDMFDPERGPRSDQNRVWKGGGGLG